jgi:hypothetical protein
MRTHRDDAEMARALSDRGFARALSLYGRGVAKVRKGRTAEDQADIAAATKLDPHIVDGAHKQGLLL